MSYISPSKVLAHLGRLADWQRGARPAPVTVEIDLSNVCSLGCRSCHFAYTHVAGPRKGSAAPEGFVGTGRFADLDVFRRAFAEMQQAGVRGVVFSGGGEPTLHPQFEAFVAAAEGLELGMYTLGGHLSDARAELIRDRFTWVVVSLDAVGGSTYAVEKRVPESRFVDALMGASRLANGRATVGISFLLHAENWRQMPEMRRLAQRLGAAYVTFRPTIETDPSDLSQIAGERAWVTDALPLLREVAQYADVEVDPDRFVEYRDWRQHPYPICYGVRLVTQITPDGKVWMCPNRRGLSNSELGDLTRESFQAIWDRHPGQWTDFTDCRAMCRLHHVNGVLAQVYAHREHEAFL